MNSPGLLKKLNIWKQNWLTCTLMSYISRWLLLVSVILLISNCQFRSDFVFLTFFLYTLYLRMGTIPISSIDTVDTCELGVSIDILPPSIANFRYRACSFYGWHVCMWYVWKPQENINRSEEKAEKCDFCFWKYFDGIGSK